MRTRNHFGPLTIVTVAMLAACSDPVQSPTAPSTGTPLFSEVDAQAGRDDYIVVLRDAESQVSATAASLAASVGGKVKDQWQDVINGFLADMTDEGAAALRRRAEVVLVEKNAPVQASATQLNAPWGLRRIDDRFLPNDLNYTYNKTGLGVHAYIIDTGIRPTHVDFTGRVLGGFSVIAGGASSIVTDMGRTSRGRWVEPPTALRRRSGFTPCACSTAPAAEPRPASSRALTGCARTGCSRRSPILASAADFRPPSTWR